MVVITLSKCPARLRGDLTKWMQEIATGVYVGNPSARVRDELWDKIVEQSAGGKAVMVFTARNEQHMDFRVSNADWQPIDFDGIKLMMRPKKESVWDNNPNAALDEAKILHPKAQPAQQQTQPSTTGRFIQDYVVLDLETTGLSDLNDRIIEIGALKVLDGTVTETFHRLIRQEKPLPQAIAVLTGLNDAQLIAQGTAEEEAVAGLLQFMGELPILAHNASFEQCFLRQACTRHGLRLPRRRWLDTRTFAKHSGMPFANLKLRTIAEHLSLPVETPHRALSDCLLTKAVYDILAQEGSDT